MADAVLTTEARMIDNVTRVMTKIQSKTLRGFNNIAKGTAAARAGLDNVVKGVFNFRNAIAGFIGFQIFKSLTNQVAQFGDKLDKMSLRTGVSVETLSKLDFVANLAGTNISALETGIRKLTKAGLDADRGLETYVRSFRELNINVRDNNGQLKDSETLFLESAKALGTVKNSTKQAALAQELFGRSGLSLIPIVNQGADAIEKQFKEAEKLGVVLNQEGRQAAVNYTDSIFKLQSAFRGLAIRELTPVIQSMSNAIEKFIADGGFDRFSTQLTVLRNTFRITFAAISDGWNGLVLIFNGVVATISSSINKIVSMTLAVLEKLPKKLIPDSWLSSLQNVQQVTKEMADENLDKLIERVNKLNKDGSALGNTFNKIRDEQNGITETVEKLPKTLKGPTGGSDGPGELSPEQQEKIKAEREKFLGQIEQIDQSFRSRNLAGKIALLEEERDAILNSEFITAEQRLLVEQEFNKRIAEERKAAADELKGNLKKVEAAQKAHADKVKKLAKDEADARKTAQRSIVDNSLKASETLAQALGATGPELKAFAITETIINGIRAVQQALASAPPPFNFGLAASVGAMAAANTAKIAAQAFQSGGFPGGVNSLVRVNEGGQEAVLNAGATNRLGFGGVNALNNGSSVRNTMTNQISYSPTININSSSNEDVIDILSRDKRRFADFIKEEMQAKNFLN